MFGWIHEGGHILATIWNGVRINSIGVNVIFGYVDSAWTVDNYSAHGIVSLMGWVATMSIAIPLAIYSYVKRKKLIFSIAWIQITGELFLWGIAPFIEFGDAYNLIKWAEYFKFNTIIDVVYFSAILCIIIYIILYVFAFYLYDKLID